MKAIKLAVLTCAAILLGSVAFMPNALAHWQETGTTHDTPTQDTGYDIGAGAAQTGAEGSGQIGGSSVGLIGVDPSVGSTLSGDQGPPGANIGGAINFDAELGQALGGGAAGGGNVSTGTGQQGMLFALIRFPKKPEDAIDMGAGGWRGKGPNGEEITVVPLVPFGRRVRIVFPPVVDEKGETTRVVEITESPPMSTDTSETRGPDGHVTQTVTVVVEDTGGWNQGGREVPNGALGPGDQVKETTTHYPPPPPPGYTGPPPTETTRTGTVTDRDGNVAF